MTTKRHHFDLVFSFGHKLSSLKLSFEGAHSQPYRPSRHGTSPSSRHQFTVPATVDRFTASAKINFIKLLSTQHFFSDIFSLQLLLIFNVDVYQSSTGVFFTLLFLCLWFVSNSFSILYPNTYNLHHDQ
jgi:hypothetical protein